jgi:Flp pilus assembly protein TadB
MNTAATKQLSFEQAAEFDRKQLPATGEKWSRRRTFIFVIGASAFLWIFMVRVVLSGF